MLIPRLSRIRLVTAALAAGVILLLLARCEGERVLYLTNMIVLHPQKMLTVDSGKVHADIAVILGGAASERASRAAELYRDGFVRQILVSGTGDTDTNILALERDGVPRNAILDEPDSRSTFENATFSSRLFRNKGIKSIIIVTSWYHSRRALACFQYVAPDLTFYSCPSYFGYAPGAENRQFINSFARRECLKLLFYRVRYGVPLGG